MKEIVLPGKVFEWSLFDFICSLGDTIDAEHIEVDFHAVSHYVPAAIVSLLTRFHRWLAQGKKVTIKNHSNCSAYGYLQRMDFFKQCGLILEEDFQRHPAEGRFVPVREVIDTEVLATEIATCMEPAQAELDDFEQTGLFDYFEYSITELGNNCVQHSSIQNFKSKAFAHAQYTTKSDKIRVAIADCGIGIRNSFKGSEHYSSELDDIGAIRKALEPNVSCSSKCHHAWGSSPNMGVGLTLMWDTVKKLGGKFIIISGEGFISSSGEEKRLGEKNVFDGTLCSFLFTRENFSKFKNCHSLLMESKTDLGLIKKNGIGGTFE